MKSTKPDTDLSRRAMLTTGLSAAAAVAVGTVAASSASAQSQTASKRFSNQTVVITGATSGIGRVTAEAFAEEGANVFFCGRREALGAEVEAGIKAKGGKATYIKADVRNKAELTRFIDAAAARTGTIDVAFNNAGIGQPFVDMASVSADNYTEMLATNLTGKYDAMVAEMPHMAEGGSIINTSSIFGVKAGANAVAYCATMHAISGMTMGAALELAPKGIRVNAVAPGAITDTDFMVPIIGRRLNAEEVKQFGALHALGRTGSSSEVAKAVLFLASKDASFLTGEIIKVDGYFLQG